MLNVEEIRKDFPLLQNDPDLIYFDNGATTLKPRCVIDAVNKYNAYTSVNVERGDYDLSFEVSNLYENTREVVRRFINASKKEEIVYTSGATASLNMIAFGLKHEINKDDIILITLAEHASNVLPWFSIAKEKGAKVDYIRTFANGAIDIDDLKLKMNDHVKVVSIAAVGNVLGYVQDINTIGKVVHQYNCYFIVDGAQSVPHIKTDVIKDDIDFLAFSAHKMCGPTGMGIIYGKYHLLQRLEPLMYGGGANARFDCDMNVILKEVPHVFEAGTPNIAGVLGLNAAICYLEKIGIENINEYEEYLKKYMIDKLSKLDNIIIYNPDSTSGIVSFNAKDVFAQDAGSFLNTKHVAIRTGNHCAKMLHNIIGTNESIRASLYFYNTTDEIDRFVEACKDINIDNCLNIFF